MPLLDDPEAPPPEGRVVVAAAYEGYTPQQLHRNKPFMRVVIGLGLASVLAVAANERLTGRRGGTHTRPMLRSVLNLQEEEPVVTAPEDEEEPTPGPDPAPVVEEEEIDNYAQEAIHGNPVIELVLVGVAGVLLLAFACDILSKVRLAVKVLRYLGTGRPDNALEQAELDAAHRQITYRFHCPKGGDAMKTAAAQQAEERRQAKEREEEAKRDELRSDAEAAS